MAGIKLHSNKSQHAWVQLPAPQEQLIWEGGVDVREHGEAGLGGVGGGHRDADGLVHRGIHPRICKIL